MKRTTLKKLLTAFVLIAVLLAPDFYAYAQNPVKTPAPKPTASATAPDAVKNVVQENEQAATAEVKDDTDTPAPVITEKDVLDHLEQITAWQRNLLSIDVAPENSLENLLKDTLTQSASKVLQYGFDFARAEATTLINAKGDAAATEDPASSHAKVTKAASDNAQHITDIQTEQAALEKKINRTRSALRTPLLIQREKLASELKIANARQDLLQSVMTLFSDKEHKNTDTVLDKVNNLSMSVPAANKDKKPAATTSAAAPAMTLPLPIALPQPAAAPDNTAAQPKSRGLITVSSDIFTLYRKKKNLDSLVQETDNLETNTQRLITTLRAILQGAVKSGNDLTSSLNSADKATIELQRQKVDVFVDNFKQQSTAVIPLAQVNKWLEASKGDLKEWRDSLDEQMTHLLRSLLIQLSLLGMAILIPVAISEATRRTIVKYVHDSKRIHQLNIVRRGTFAFVILVIIILNFVTELDSLATFAGFLTAGLAVALQNVILSLVAHFFYFGRFGIRVGDRVKIKDITGEVVQVGMVRLYLMELGGPDYELYPTGRIVAYPNSILFQNDPFIKQISGADYIWQEITFILDPSSDYQLANKKLNEAVNIVYAQYHDVMESQKQAMTRSTHLDVTMPAPRGFLNFTDAGLALIIRYPIQTDHVEEINQRITKELLKAIEEEPSLKLISSNPPKIVAVDSDKS
jgi:small-conductance mechanosensitive channel